MEILQVFDLDKEANILACNLPYGKQRKLEIARALATDPKIIIADEPTASLDTKGGLEILGMLMKLNSEGKTVIIFTKDEELSEQFGKRMITLDFGEVVSDRPELSESTEVKNEAV